MQSIDTRKNLVAVLAGAVMALAASGVEAQQQFRFNVGGSSVVWSEIYRVESEAGESREAFMHRAGERMTEWTAGTNYEACAEICKAVDSDRFVLPIGTLGAHTACATAPDMCPAGTVSTGENMHTHPHSRYRPNAVDQAMAGMTGQNHNRSQKGAHGPRTGFSPADYSRPGYLAQPGGRLMYQNGVGTAKIVPND